MAGDEVGVALGQLGDQASGRQRWQRRGGGAEEGVQGVARRARVAMDSPALSQVLRRNTATHRKGGE